MPDFFIPSDRQFPAGEQFCLLSSQIFAARWLEPNALHEASFGGESWAIANASGIATFWVPDLPSESGGTIASWGTLNTIEALSRGHVSDPEAFRHLVAGIDLRPEVKPPYCLVAAVPDLEQEAGAAPAPMPSAVVMEPGGAIALLLAALFSLTKLDLDVGDRL